MPAPREHAIKGDEQHNEKAAGASPGGRYAITDQPGRR
jgi:hypothetical protein